MADRRRLLRPTQSRRCDLEPSACGPWRCRGPVGKRVFFREGEERLIHSVRRSSAAVTGAGKMIEGRPFGLPGQRDPPAPGHGNDSGRAEYDEAHSRQASRVEGLAKEGPGGEGGQDRHHLPERRTSVGIDARGASATSSVALKAALGLVSFGQHPCRLRSLRASSAFTTPTISSSP